MFEESVWEERLFVAAEPVLTEAVRQGGKTGAETGRCGAPLNDVQFRRSDYLASLYKALAGGEAMQYAAWRQRHWPRYRAPCQMPRPGNAAYRRLSAQ